MAVRKTVVGDRLQYEDTPASTKESFSKEELEGKAREIQTRIDHLNVDFTDAQGELSVMNADIALLP